MTPEQIKEALSFHPADTADKRTAHEIVRAAGMAYAGVLSEMLPPSRERSLWFTAIQEATMWANAALAIHGGPADPARLTVLRDAVLNMEHALSDAEDPDLPGL